MTNYIFKKDSKNKLQFHGDFEGLYLNEDDPWGQSAKDRKEYMVSRKNQINILRGHKNSGALIDIGCGLGFTSNFFSQKYIVTGIDISETAIRKAKENYPNIDFVCHDIRKSYASVKKYDVVVLNQVLWYVMKEFSEVLMSVSQLLKSDGYLLISNFILDKKNQQYGNEFFSGHAEILPWLERESSIKGFNVDAYFCERLDQKFYDFHSILSLKNDFE